MSKANEPAFPVNNIESRSLGMSLRTYIATQVMIGLLGTYEQMEQYSVNGGHLDVEQIASDAVKAADALILELEKTEK